MARPEDRVNDACLTIKIVRSHQQLKAQLSWDIHIRYISRVLVLFVVVEVLADLFKHEAAVQGLEVWKF